MRRRLSLEKKLALGEGTVMGQQKLATCFATLLPKELNSDIARFTSHVQTCLATSQVVAGCAN